jgi:CRP-like cAMP-binding protein
VAEDLPMAERILELRKVRVLRSLSTSALITIADEIELETCEAGALLAEEGEEADAIAWILEGGGRWSRAGETLGAAEPGSAIGMLPVLAGLASPCSARAVVPTLVARVAAERFLELLEDSFDLALSVLGAIAADLRDGGQRTLGRRLGAASRLTACDLDFTARLVRLRMSAPFTRAPIRPLAVLAQRGAARTAVVIVAGSVHEGDVGLGPGDTVGLLCGLAARERDVAAVASTALTGIEISVDALIDLLEDDDELALELLRVGAGDLLALRAEQGLAPDVFAVAPDASLLRLPAIAAEPRSGPRS